MARDEFTVLFDLWLAANATRGLLDRELRASGLTGEEYALYSALRTEPGLTPSEVCRLLGMPPTTVSSVLSRLERRGHLQRESNPADNRSHRVLLTDDGRAAHARATQQFEPVMADVETHLQRPLTTVRDAIADLTQAVQAVSEIQGNRRAT